MKDLLSLIQSGETETVEFKEQWDDDSALKTLAAFANTRGGRLCVGVTDDGQIVGWPGANRELERISHKVVNFLHRHPESMATEKVQGKQILVVQMPPSTSSIAYQGRYFRRVGNTTREILPDELGRFLMDRMGLTWDSLTTDFNESDLAPESIQHFIDLAQKRLPFASSSEKRETLLEKLRLRVDGKLTRAAILLFGKDPQGQFLSAQIHMGRFKDAVTIIDDKMIGGNLFQQLDQVMRIFQQYLQVRYEIPTQMGNRTGIEALQRREIWEFPLEALREAVINAAIHRDYSSPAHIQVRVYDDKVTISNPGALPADLTVDELKREGHASIPRNPLLAQIFYYASLIEQWGTGTFRITQTCRDQDLPEPEFVSRPSGFPSPS